MSNIKSLVLTDLPAGTWIEAGSIHSDKLSTEFPTPWVIQKRTLRGGVRDGVDVIDVNNGALSFSVLPTRGMGIWRGEYRGHRLGWTAPLQGPVHPKFVNLLDRGGLGFLSGFDEWICRCGLSSNGPPGHDPVSKEFLTLHGRIANTPAHHVELKVDLEPPHELKIIGQVDEAALFFSNLRLTSTIVTTPGSNVLVIQDEVENRRSEPAEFELLYHCNFGPPFLEEGSRVRAPVHEVVPRDDSAAEGIHHYETCAGPKAGFAEQVFYYDLLADDQDCTLAMLHTAEEDLGVVLRMVKSELPRFVLWKNTAAEEDGYVTGLEPATNYPNFKHVERKHHRVITLPPQGRYTCTLIVEIRDSKEGVAEVLKEIEAIQAKGKAIMHQTPQAKYCE